MQNFYRKIIKIWGLPHQLCMFAEEVGELLQAVNKYHRNPFEENRKQVITEIADVSIMIEQVMTAFNIQKWEVYNEKYWKLERLEKKAGLSMVKTEFNCDVVIEYGSKADFNPVKIQCPGCKVVYEVDEVQYSQVTCMDCGAAYMQSIHNMSRPEYIRQALYRCRG